MEKIKCIIRYDGTDFHGFQIQPHQRTVQGEVEHALQKMHKGKAIRLHPSGRTDAGVHAMAQTIHFETSLQLDPKAWKKALNTLLPDDIYIKQVEKVPATFHARFSALEKEYRYMVLNETEPNVFRRNYVYQFPYTVDVDQMNKACKYLEGQHDFTSFSSAKSTAKGSKIRTIYEASCMKNGSEIIFIFRGDGFLYHMVRILVGTLLEVGQGKHAASHIRDVLAKRDRQWSGMTAPAQGLYLWNVAYKTI